MRGLLEVREFDRITCNLEFKTEYAYLPEPVFRELESFIHVFSGDEEHADALEFMRIGYRRNVGDIISMNNYVGLIQIRNGYQVQVLPKIDFGDNPDRSNEETKRVFLRMLQSMKDFPSRVFSEANLRIDRMPLYEIYINMYLQEVRTLVKHGIRSAYTTRSDNQKYFKGKLVVNEHIRQNTVHSERFYMCYDEYMIDRAENRLVKATLIKLLGLSDSAENQKEIRQLLTAFETINASVNYQKDFSEVVIDRNTKDYEALMRWSKVFLLNKSFATFSGKHNARALLFPMEKVFEAYAAQWIKRVFADLDWEISVQDKGYYLFDTPKRFALRPDIVIRRGDGSTIVLDTKWKALVNDPGVNYGISQADMYQMYAYAKKYDTPEVWLLYPVNRQMRDRVGIRFDSGDSVHVHLYFVDVADIEKSMTRLKNMLI